MCFEKADVAYTNQHFLIDLSTGDVLGSGGQALIRTDRGRVSG